MQKLLVAVFLLTWLIAPAQIDPNKLDSLKRSIDANAKALQSWQDSFTKKQDSLYKIQLELAQEQSRNDAEAIQSEEKAERKKQWILISIGIAMLVVILLLLRRQKSN